MRAIKIFITTAIFFAIATPIFALEIEPLRLELSLSPGKTSTTKIKVTNWLDYSVKVNVKPDYYRYIGGKKDLPSCESWLKLEPSAFELSSKASMYVKCTINVPKDAKEEHLAAILFDEEGLITTYEKSPTEPGDATLKIIPRFTIPVYITIKGEEVRSAKIVDMKIVEGPAVGTIKAEITLQNKGTIHLRPSGTLAFMDSGGNIVKTLPIGECLPIFPGYEEKIPVYYPNLFEPGAYTAVSTINVGAGKLLQKKTSFRITEDYDLE